MTVRNLVRGLRDRCDFKILTADRDLGDTRAYAGITTNSWNRIDDCEIFYASPGAHSLRSISRQLSNDHYDVLHLNTIFSRRFGILPLIIRRFGYIGKKPTIVAPRGELAPSALAIKSIRKRSFLLAARALALFRQVIWQASSPQEARDIHDVVGAEAQIVIVPDLLNPDYLTWEPSRYQKKAGRLDILFLARLSPIKNLDLAIETLRGLEGEIALRIAGPVDDPQYWAQCRRLIATLGANLRVDYCGPIAPSEVARCMSDHGLFFLPSAGESFGFSILEAMLAGCPVLISDRTPWRNLQQNGVGWDLPLADKEGFRKAIKECIAMDAESHRAMSYAARNFALQYISRDASAARTAALFHSALNDRPQVTAVT